MSLYSIMKPKRDNGARRRAIRKQSGGLFSARELRRHIVSNTPHKTSRKTAKPQMSVISAIRKRGTSNGVFLVFD